MKMFASAVLLATLAMVLVSTQAAPINQGDEKFLDLLIRFLSDEKVRVIFLGLDLRGNADFTKGNSHWKNLFLNSNEFPRYF